MDPSDFPNNSNSHREETKAIEGGERRKIDPVVTGRVIHKKPSVGRRLKGLFAPDGEENFLVSLLRDAVVPVLRDVAADMVRQTVNRAVGIDDHRGSYRHPGGYTSTPRYYSGSSTTHTNYSSFSSDRREPPRDDRSTVRRSNRLDDIIVRTSAEAEGILTQMDEISREFGTVSLQDLREMLNEPTQHTDRNFGWDLEDVSRMTYNIVGQGYLLRIPQPRPLR